MIENFKEGKQLIIVFCPRELQGGKTISNCFLRQSATRRILWKKDLQNTQKPLAEQQK